MITDEVREEAALICAISASSGLPSGEGRAYIMLGQDLGAELQAGELAGYAWQEAMNRNVAINGVWRWTREVDAEAEALLRTGWNPFA